MRETLSGVERQVEVSHESRVLEAHFFPVRDEAGAVAMGLLVTEDVTERRALQAKLAVSARLAAMGTLVAGVAHEINNPLTGQLAEQGLALEELQELARHLDGDGPLDRGDLRRRVGDVMDSLRDAQAGGQRIAAIVRDLSLFGRPDPRRTRVRLLDVVEDALRWVPASIQGSATIQVENGDAPDVVVSSGQIAQVVVNLVTNGAKASPPGRRGVVRVRLSRGAGGTARLEVADVGTGIPPEVMSRIFDPFFTTRTVGQGMGLGLPICHAIVTAHGGTITAESTPGSGATFLVELPAAPDGA
jgi:signal transduction histidine kinase